jgi:hypothetical protein
MKTAAIVLVTGSSSDSDDFSVVNWCEVVLVTFLHICMQYLIFHKLNLNSVVLVRERTVPTEQPPLVGEVSANFCG